MSETYITKIVVKKSRNVENFEIPLSESERQHLIITGKNGSGKTSLLLEIDKYLEALSAGEYQYYESMVATVDSMTKQLVETPLLQRDHLINQITHHKAWLEKFGGTDIDFSTGRQYVGNVSTAGHFIIAYFNSRRTTTLNIPSGINKIEILTRYESKQRANTNFLQFIVNLKADRSFAKDDNELITVATIDEWFKRFELSLKKIFDTQNLKLFFDRRSYNFLISVDDQQPFTFDAMSDGYSSILGILTEIIMRMEAYQPKSYDLEGVVLIDEIETHLHVDLQKKILPFLTEFFPKIQFIVTTHSPFVLSSLPNATICDLETKVVTTDLTGYSYDALIESYFRTDKYSNELKKLVNEYEELIRSKSKSPSNTQRKKFLKEYLANTPKYLSKELFVKIQQLELLQLE